MTRPSNGSDRRHGGFLKDVAQLGSGTALAQGLMMLSMPVLSRLYDPDAFGIAAVYLSILMVLSVISGLRYELAVLLPEEEQDAADLFRLHLVLTLGIATASGAILWILRARVAGWLHAPALADYLWLVGPGVFLYGILNALNAWNTRRKRFGMLATTRVVGSAGMVASQLAAGLGGLTSAGGLIAGGLLGRGLEDSIQGWRIARDSRAMGWRPLAWSRLLALGRRHRKFPIYNSWAALINTLSWQAPAFMLAFFFSPGVVGWYAVGDRVIRTPMNIIGRALAQVFLQRGVEAHRQQRLGHLFLETLRVLGRLGLAPIIVLTFTAQDLFALILGQQWAEAGVYVQILGPWAFIWFISSPMATITTITERQEQSLAFNGVILATRLASFVIGGLGHDPRLALTLFTISGVLAYGWVLLWVGGAAGVPAHRTLRAMLGPHAVLGVGMMAILTAAKLLHVPPLGIAGLDGGLLLAYYAYLLRRYRQLLPGASAP